MAPDRTPIEELPFTEFRRKVRDSELLSSSTERLAKAARFNGRIIILVQNGCVLKSGYEESYFSRRRHVSESLP